MITINPYSFLLRLLVEFILFLLVLILIFVIYGLYYKIKKNEDIPDPLAQKNIFIKLAIVITFGIVLYFFP